MAPPVAVVDTVALILLIETASDKDTLDRMQRREANRIAFEDMKKQGTRFVVPTPVIAEMHAGTSGLQTIRNEVTKRLHSLRTVPLDAQAADIASIMRKDVLQSRDGRERRGAVSYDALIAAIAHRIEARWILSPNPGDMRRCLAVVRSAVEVVDTTTPPKTGQLHIIANRPRPSEPPPE